jgi:hypothetical protein
MVVVGCFFFMLKNEFLRNLRNLNSKKVVVKIVVVQMVVVENSQKWL